MPELQDNEYRAQRLAHMRRLAEMGYPPYGKAFKRTGSLAEIRHNCRDGEKVAAAGRLTTIRDMGKTVFADLGDGSDRFQIYARGDILGDRPYAAFKLLDLGDTIGVQGELFTTRTGERTIKVEGWTLLAKALRLPPEKWHGLRDVETRYRQRYLDLIANPEVRRRFEQRSLAIHHIRKYLFERGFIEVETPMLQPSAGGATARPFVTRYESLGRDMYLRIAPELYLKRLLVGGFDRVFELNKNFRNEGISRTHSPEFTMLEIYEAYADLSSMRELVEALVLHVADTVFGSRTVGKPQNPIELSPPWREVSYKDLVTECAGSDWFELSPQQAAARASSLGLTVDPSWDMTLITHEVYEKLVEKTLHQPTVVTRLPAILIPLAKACDDDPTCAEVFELVIGGMEVAPAYTELNDPIQQRERLLRQVAANAEKLDEDFINALEHGMPPAGGMGVGIDRLMMLFCGVDSIRDVILFPHLRPITEDVEH